MIATNPPKGMHRVTPQLFYKDIEAAITWLQQHFNCKLTEQYRQANKECVYAELNFFDATILVAPQSRYSKASSPNQSGSFSASVLVYLDDIDDFAYKLEDQQLIIIEPLTLQPWGDKTIRVLDCEGHLWTFATHVVDVAIGI